MSDDAMLTLHLAVTLYLVGMIWTVQLVHYPLLGRVGHDGFRVYAAEHRRRIVVALLPWPVEVLLAAWLVVAQPVPAALAFLGAALAVVTVLSTVAIQVPLHQRLDRGYDRPTIRRLTATNWLRTGAWTGRGLVATAMLVA